MTNRALASLGALLLTAAAPPSFPPLALVAPVAPFGTPATPRDEAAPPTTGFVPAPMPDQDINAPLAQGGSSGGLRPGLTMPDAGPTTTSNGFTPGSTYSGEQTRRFMPAPTLNLDLPLH